MNWRKISIVAVQETELNEHCSLQRCKGYNVFKKDRSKRGGLAFLLHYSVQYKPISLELVSSYLSVLNKVLNVSILPFNSRKPTFGRQ